VSIHHRIRLPGLRGLAAGCAALFVWLSSCAPSGFQDEAQLQGGVRILASSADHPYAVPGQAVRVDVLAYDGRSAADRNTSPMHVYWFPLVCENPAQDAYYACFAQLASPDGGAPGHVVGDDASVEEGLEAAGEPEPGADADTAADATMTDADLDASSDTNAGADSAAGVDVASDAEADAGSSVAPPVVSTFSFVVPSDAVSSHPATPGTTPYGLLVAFNFACAGQLMLLPASGNPQAPPLGCVDSTGQLVGPDSYVFGYTRVYAYAPDAGTAGMNTNPVVDCVDIRGSALVGAATAGDGGGSSGSNGACAGMAPLIGTAPSLSVPRIVIPCTTSGNCPNIKIGPHVTADSWEFVANGLHEEIWADYYSTFGTFTHDSTLLYDPTAGLIGTPSATDTEFDPPASTAGLDGFLWIVVHDNRGGAAWVTVPVHVGP
jgi:hypothetical protein